MKAITNVGPIADFESDNDDNIFIKPERDKLKNKIRLLRDYSVKILMRE